MESGTKNSIRTLHVVEPHGSTSKTDHQLMLSGESVESNEPFRRHVKRDPWMLQHKAVYALVCVAGVAVSPFLPLYLTGVVRLSAAQLGFLFSLRPLVTLVAAPVWGALADAFSSACRPVLLGTAGGGAAVRYSVATAPAGALAGAGAAVLASDALSAPVFSLIDAATMAHLEATSSTAHYGASRAFGPLGIALFGFATGPLLACVGLRGMFLLHLALMAPVMLLLATLPLPGQDTLSPPSASAQTTVTEQKAGGGSLSDDAGLEAAVAQSATLDQEADITTLPATPSASEASEAAGPAYTAPPQPDVAEKKRAIERTLSAAAKDSLSPRWAAVMVLLTSADVVLFLAIMLLMGALNAVIGSYEFLYLTSELNAPPSLLGAVLTVSCAAEVRGPQNISLSVSSLRYRIHQRLNQFGNHHASLPVYCLSTHFFPRCRCPSSWRPPPSSAVWASPLCCALPWPRTSSAWGSEQALLTFLFSLTHGVVSKRSTFISLLLVAALLFVPSTWGGALW